MKRLLAIAFAMTAAAAALSPAWAGEAHLVVSDRLPALALRVSPAFTALPPLHFPIENLTDAERRIFVEAAPDRRLLRMVVVQYERVQAGSDFRFVFPSRPPRRFGAETWRAGAFVYDDVRAAADAPSREAARTRALLLAQGYRPPRLWRVARLARVSDAAGLGEVILFYMESADAEFGPGPLPGADADGDLPLEGAARAALFDRLAGAVEAVRG